MKNIFILPIAFSLLGLIMITPIAEASTMESAVKNLDSSLNQLITAKDDVISGGQLSPEEDLAFRKKVVNNALILSLKEIEDMRAKFDTLKFSDKSTELSLKKQYVADLGEFEAYYRDLQGKLDKENDVEKIKDAAREAKIYREETYSPVISKALEFILTFQTDKLVSSADIRYGKIENDIKKLERANFIEPGFFGHQMSESKKLISDARNLVDRSKMIVTGAETEDKSEDKNTDDTEIKKNITPTPRELCEAALVNLKSGYSIFVDISGSVKKILKL